MADLLARKCYRQLVGKHRWLDIPHRKRRQMKHRAKRWLNTVGLEHMTVELLYQQDPQGDVRAWLEAIQWLATEAD